MDYNSLNKEELLQILLKKDEELSQEKQEKEFLENSLVVTHNERIIKSSSSINTATMKDIFTYTQSEIEPEKIFDELNQEENEIITKEWNLLDKKSLSKFFLIKNPTEDGDVQPFINNVMLPLKKISEKLSLFYYSEVECKSSSKAMKKPDFAIFKKKFSQYKDNEMINVVFCLEAKKSIVNDNYFNRGIFDIIRDAVLKSYCYDKVSFSSLNEYGVVTDGKRWCFAMITRKRNKKEIGKIFNYYVDRSKIFTLDENDFKTDKPPILLIYLVRLLKTLIKLEANGLQKNNTKHIHSKKVKIKIDEKNNSEFILGKLIYNGNFKSVYEVFDCDNNKYAMKIWLYGGYENMIHEVKIIKMLQKYNSENLPKLISYGWISSSPAIVLDPFGKSLHLLASILEHQELSYIIQEIKKTLHLLHINGYVHCDVKPENILLIQKTIHSSKVKPILIDFENTIMMNKKPKQFNGTMIYASINQIKGGTLTEKDDFESLKYVEEYLKNGALPWDNDKDIDMIVKKKSDWKINMENASVYNTH